MDVIKVFDFIHAPLQIFHAVLTKVKRIPIMTAIFTLSFIQGVCRYCPFVPKR